MKPPNRYDQLFLEFITSKTFRITLGVLVGVVAIFCLTFFCVFSGVLASFANMLWNL